MGKTTEERQAAIEKKRQTMQAIVDMRADGRTFAEIAEAFGHRWSRQRADQLYREALAEGLTPTPQEA